MLCISFAYLIFSSSLCSATTWKFVAKNPDCKFSATEGSRRIKSESLWTFSSRFCPVFTSSQNLANWLLKSLKNLKIWKILFLAKVLEYLVLRHHWIFWILVILLSFSCIFPRLYCKILTLVVILRIVWHIFATYLSILQTDKYHKCQQMCFLVLGFTQLR